MLDISQWFSKDPTATREATYHSHLLYLLATNGYVGGYLLRIVLNAGITLMEDNAFDKIFPGETPEDPPSRIELQHAIHQNAEMAIQISVMGFILQEVNVDIITQNYEVVSDMLLETKLLYHQGRIHKYRLEPYRHIQNIRRGQPHTSGETKMKGKALWTQ